MFTDQDQKFISLSMDSMDWKKLLGYIGAAVLVIVVLVAVIRFFERPRLTSDGHYEENAIPQRVIADIEKNAVLSAEALKEKVPELEAKASAAREIILSLPEPTIDPRLAADPVVQEHIEGVYEERVIPPDAFEISPR